MEGWTTQDWRAVYLREALMYLRDELRDDTLSAHRREDRARSHDYAVRMLALETVGD